MSKIFFFRPKVFSQKLPVSMGEVHPFPPQKWAFPDCWHFFVCFFGCSASLLTSEDQRVDGWLLQKIISLQTDCFIELYIFSKRRGSGS